MDSINFTKSIYESSVFIQLGKDNTYIVVFVDDLFLTSTSPRILDNTIKKIAKQFKIKLTPINKFIGMEIIDFQMAAFFFIMSRWLPADLLQQAQQQCQQNYEQDFLHSLSRICPHGTKPMSTGHHLVKKMIPIIIGVVVLVGVVVAGAWICTAAYIKADNNGYRPKGLEDSYTKIVADISKRYSDVSKIIKDVVKEFNLTGTVCTTTWLTSSINQSVKLTQSWYFLTNMRTNWNLFYHKDINSLLLLGNELDKI